MAEYQKVDTDTHVDVQLNCRADVFLRLTLKAQKPRNDRAKSKSRRGHSSSTGPKLV